MSANGMSTIDRLNYFLWAGVRILNADTACPACNEVNTLRVRRKYLVTALYRCPACELMFRVPKPSPEECIELYQSEYKQGFTTDCPAPDELKRLKDSCFVGSGKDYSGYIEVLRSIPLKQGSTILDFGSSWGYGSWQFARAGYKVYSYEISRPRASYAAERLDCNLCTPHDLPEKVDCLFSSHVIEHLTNPRELWEVARAVVKPEGIVVLFLPNGDLPRQAVDGTFHQTWGQVHPLLISPLALKRMAELYGFTPRCYSSPYDMEEIAAKAEGAEGGPELLVVASR